MSSIYTGQSRKNTPACTIEIHEAVGGEDSDSSGGAEERASFERFARPPIFVENPIIAEDEVLDPAIIVLA